MLRIIVFGLFNIALIIAQVFIVRGKSLKKGLIIPIFNTVLALGFALFASPYSVTTSRFIDGIEVEQRWVNAGGFIGSFFGILIILLIPAIVNFLIYFIERRKREMQKVDEIEKMRINDL
jgi:hypothetical protein